MPKAKLTVMEQIEEVKRQTLVYECAKGFEAWAAGINARMLAGDPSMQAGAVYSTSEEEPVPGRSNINPIPAWRARTLAGQAHPPLGALTDDIHEDLIRRFYVEPEIEAHKRELEANRKRLQDDIAKWWREQ